MHALKQRCKQSCIVGVVQVVMQEVGDVEHAPVQRLQVAGQAVQLPTLGQQQLKHQLQDLQGTGICRRASALVAGLLWAQGEWSGRRPGHASALSRASTAISTSVRLSRDVFAKS